MHAQSANIVRRSVAALVATAILATGIWLVTAQGQSEDPGAPPASSAIPAARPARPAAPFAPPAVPAAAQEDLQSHSDIPTEILFKLLRDAFKSTSADQTDESLTLRFVRDDVFLIIGGNQVPASAGIEHTFHFYRCPCGTMLTHGSFVLYPYEVNDVVDMLRQNPQIKIVGTGAFLLDEQPRLTVLRFQGEGHADQLARSLQAAFRWIGEARSQPMNPPQPG